MVVRVVFFVIVLGHGSGGRGGGVVFVWVGGVCGVVVQQDVGK